MKSTIIIDFHHAKTQQFLAISAKIMAHPYIYLDFTHVADFYAAAWLSEFPQGSTWCATGLDDGAEQFYGQICYLNYCLSFDVGQSIQVNLQQPLSGLG